MSFDEFLTQFLDRSPDALRRWDTHQLSCAEFLLDQDGLLSPNVHIIRYDSKDLLATVAEFLFPQDLSAQEIFCKPGHRAGGANAFAVEELTESQIARINAFFHLDNELLFTE